jgi:hypothetical protein
MPEIAGFRLRWADLRNITPGGMSPEWTAWALRRASAGEQGWPQARHPADRYKFGPTRTGLAGRGLGWRAAGWASPMRAGLAVRRRADHGLLPSGPGMAGRTRPRPTTRRRVPEAAAGRHVAAGRVLDLRERIGGRVGGGSLRSATWKVGPSPGARYDVQATKSTGNSVNVALAARAHLFRTTAADSRFPRAAHGRAGRPAL